MRNTNINKFAPGMHSSLSTAEMNETVLTELVNADALPGKGVRLREKLSGYVYGISGKILSWALFDDSVWFVAKALTSRTKCANQLYRIVNGVPTLAYTFLYGDKDNIERDFLNNNWHLSSTGEYLVCSSGVSFINGEERNLSPWYVRRRVYSSVVSYEINNASILDFSYTGDWVSVDVIPYIETTGAVGNDDDSSINPLYATLVDYQAFSADIPSKTYINVAVTAIDVDGKEYVLYNRTKNLLISEDQDVGSYVGSCRALRIEISKDIELPYGIRVFRYYRTDYSDLSNSTPRLIAEFPVNKTIAARDLAISLPGYVTIYDKDDPNTWYAKSGVAIFYGDSPKTYPGCPMSGGYINMASMIPTDDDWSGGNGLHANLAGLNQQDPEKLSGRYSYSGMFPVVAWQSFTTVPLTLGYDSSSTDPDNYMNPIGIATLGRYSAITTDPRKRGMHKHAEEDYIRWIGSVGNMGALLWTGKLSWMTGTSVCGSFYVKEPVSYLTPVSYYPNIFVRDYSEDDIPDYYGLNAEGSPIGKNFTHGVTVGTVEIQPQAGRYYAISRSNIFDREITAGDLGNETVVLLGRGDFTEFDPIGWPNCGFGAIYEAIHRTGAGELCSVVDQDFYFGVGISNYGRSDSPVGSRSFALPFSYNTNSMGVRLSLFQVKAFVRTSYSVEAGNLTFLYGVSTSSHSVGLVPFYCVTAGGTSGNDIVTSVTSINGSTVTYSVQITSVNGQSSSAVFNQSGSSNAVTAAIKRGYVDQWSPVLADYPVVLSNKTYTEVLSGGLYYARVSFNAEVANVFELLNEDDFEHIFMHVVVALDCTYVGENIVTTWGVSFALSGVMSDISAPTLEAVAGTSENVVPDALTHKGYLDLPKSDYLSRFLFYTPAYRLTDIDSFADGFALPSSFLVPKLAPVSGLLNYDLQKDVNAHMPTGHTDEYRDSVDPCTVSVRVSGWFRSLNEVLGYVGVEFSLWDSSGNQLGAGLYRCMSACLTLDGRTAYLSFITDAALTADISSDLAVIAKAERSASSDIFMIDDLIDAPSGEQFDVYSVLSDASYGFFAEVSGVKFFGSIRSEINESETGSCYIRWSASGPPRIRGGFDRVATDSPITAQVGAEGLLWVFTQKGITAYSFTGDSLVIVFQSVGKTVKGQGSVLVFEEKVYFINASGFYAVSRAGVSELSYTNEERFRAWVSLVGESEVVLGLDLDNSTIHIGSNKAPSAVNTSGVFHTWTYDTRTESMSAYSWNIGAPYSSPRTFADPGVSWAGLRSGSVTPHQGLVSVLFYNNPNILALGWNEYSNSVVPIAIAGAGSTVAATKDYSYAIRRGVILEGDAYSLKVLNGVSIRVKDGSYIDSLNPLSVYIASDIYQNSPSSVSFTITAGDRQFLLPKRLEFRTLSYAIRLPINILPCMVEAIVFSWEPAGGAFDGAGKFDTTSAIVFS